MKKRREDKKRSEEKKRSEVKKKREEEKIFSLLPRDTSPLSTDISSRLGNIGIRAFTHAIVTGTSTNKQGEFCVLRTVTCSINGGLF